MGRCELVRAHVENKHAMCSYLCAGINKTFAQSRYGAFGFGLRSLRTRKKEKSFYRTMVCCVATCARIACLPDIRGKPCGDCLKYERQRELKHTRKTWRGRISIHLEFSLFSEPLRCCRRPAEGDARLGRIETEKFVSITGCLFVACAPNEIWPYYTLTKHILDAFDKIRGVILTVKRHVAGEWKNLRH